MLALRQARRHGMVFDGEEIPETYYTKQSRVPKLRALNQNKFSFYLTMG